MGQRVFISCASGFILRHLLPYFDEDDQVTVLMLAEPGLDPDASFQRLLSLVGVDERKRKIFRSITGDLFGTDFGLSSLSAIDASYWILGSVPFRFGHPMRESMEAAEAFAQSLIATANRYHTSVEPIQHALFLSSVYSVGPEVKELPEAPVPLGSLARTNNFPACKRIAESRIVEALGNRCLYPAAIVRIQTGLSDRSDQVGGIINLLVHEVSRSGLQELYLPLSWAIDFDDIHLVAQALKAIVFSPYGDGLGCFNLVDRSVRLTFADFVESYNRHAGTRLAVRETPQDSQAGKIDRRVSVRIRQLCDFFLAPPYTEIAIQTGQLSYCLGPAPLAVTRPHKLRILDHVVGNCVRHRCIPNHQHLGRMPIY